MTVSPLRLVALALLTASLLSLAAPAEAQVRILRNNSAAVDSSLAARYSLADSYLRVGQFDRAIALLEDLYDTSPETYVFYDRLKQAYEGVKRYDDAIALMDDQLTYFPGSLHLLTEKARLIYLKGDEQGALAAWDDALAASDDPNRFRAVSNAMVDVRLLDAASATLVRGRTTAGDSTLYQSELAYLYNLTGQHGQAADEYLSLLASDPQRLSFVRNRLSRFVEQQGALRATIAAAERAVRRDPLNRAYRELLGWLYMENDTYAKAFDTYRAIDRLEGEDGRVLFEFAQRAADARAYDAAGAAYDEILTRYPDTPMAPEALLGRGEMHQRWAETSFEQALDARGRRLKAPHFTAALATYRAFLERYPTHAYYPEVLRRIARLQQDVFFDLDAAQATLTDITQRYPNSTTANDARYDLGRLALSRGDLDEAGLLFARLVDDLRLGELAELARYEQALIHFYKGEFEAASTLATVLDENTSTDVANDAIRLKVLIATNKGPDSLNTPLHRYAEAALQQRQRRPDDALVVLDSLLSMYGQHPLADEVRFLRAQALRDGGDPEAAIQAFAELPLVHPDSPFADRSLFEAASLQWSALGDAESAMETYTRLLTTYPGSLLASDARAAIRRLRGDPEG